MDERQEWLNRQRQRWEVPTPDDPVHRDQNGNVIEHYHVCGCAPPSAPPALDVPLLRKVVYGVADADSYDLGMSQEVARFADEVAAEYARLQEPER